MHLEEAINQRLEKLALVREEHVTWYSSLVKQAIYGDLKSAPPIALPTSFQDWYLEISSEEGLMNLQTISQIKDIHDELHQAGERFDGKARATQKKPSSDDFDDLTTLLEEFLKNLGRFVRDCVLKDSGIDALTGLRSKDVVMQDLKIEMERLERQGKQFCIVMMRIDHFEKIQKENDANVVEGHVKEIAELLRNGVRSFDDAFAYDVGEFLLCLKQTDVPGGITSIDRLREAITSKGLIVHLDSKTVPLSISCCLASPFEEDNVEELLKFLKEDLDSKSSKTGAILEYQDISPLQRFIQKDG